MARAGTVAVVLPGAFYTLKEKRIPPIEALREHGASIAVATDCNPGSSPLASLLLAMNMACTLFRMTPEDALAGVTRNGAKALGIDGKYGTLEVGKRADLVVVDQDLFEIEPDQVGKTKAILTMLNGQVVYRSDEADQ